jgi:hypothetical protein
MMRLATMVLSLTAVIGLVGCACQECDTMDCGCTPNSSAAAPANADTYDYFTPNQFVTKTKNGRIWVFRPGSEGLKEFTTTGGVGDHVTLVGVGPDGETMKSPEKENIVGYLLAEKGFVVAHNKNTGRMWVFSAGSEELRSFQAGHEPAKMVTKVGAGPMGKTIRAVEKDTIDAYLAAK